MTEPTAPSSEIAVRREAPLARPNVDREITDGWIDIMRPVINLALEVAGTEFVPRGMRDKPAAVTAAILHGREMGLPPMTALAGTHMIEGKPTLSAETLRALVLAAGHTLEVVTTTGVMCEMRARRRGSDTFTTLTWTLAMAQAAGLAGKDVWKKYPRQMLMARCSAEIIRAVFPDVAHGMGAAEEALDDSLSDDPEAPAEPATVPVQRQPVTRARRTRSGGVSATQEEHPRPAAPQDAPEAAEIPLPAADGAQDAPTPPTPTEDTPETPPVDQQPDATLPKVVEMTAPLVTASQLRLLGARWSDLDVGDQDRRDYTAALTGNPKAVETTKHVTKREAMRLIDLLSKVETREEVDALVGRAIAGEDVYAPPGVEQ